MNEDLLTRLLTATDGPVGRLLLLHGARGAGKSWWIEHAGQRARSGGLTVHHAAGRDCPADAADAMLAHAADAKACILVDDIDVLDVQFRRALRAAVETSGGIAIVTAGSSTAFDGALGVRLEPLSSDAIVELLGHRGVAPRAARRCATAASGNPGLAVSLADGLSDAQRADRAAVPEMPRLAAEVAADLHARLRRLGEPTCRALMVAAADEDGDLLAIRTALRQLGETARDDGLDETGTLEALFDDAEEAAVVDVVGSRVTFVDPWLRLAAYHLVAPASRRAAHRALAAAYGSPRQGDARVRHLVAASNGPSDDVAQALIVVAAAAARRGDRAAAARMASQAADLSVSSELRSAHLLRAIGWCLDGGDYAQAARLVSGLDGLDADEQRAASEVSALLLGDDAAAAGETAGAAPMSERELATWQGRHRQRMSWWADSAAGRHARPIQQIGAGAPPAELWARGMALRHGGFIRDAAELAERTLATLAPGESHVRERWDTLEADLAVLTGREVERVPSSRSDGGEWRAILARAALATSPMLQRDTTCIHLPAQDPLREIRSQQLLALSNSDHRLLAVAAATAHAHGLPIEAGESWLMAAEMAATPGTLNAPDSIADYVRQASEVLHRCAVRGWDTRLQQLLTAVHAQPAPASATATDTELDALSVAEWRVAASVAEGLTNREVAAALFLSVKTVDFHLQQIYRKLALRSRTELAVRVAGRTSSSPARRPAPSSQEHVNE